MKKRKHPSSALALAMAMAVAGSLFLCSACTININLPSETGTGSDSVQNGTEDSTEEIRSTSDIKPTKEPESSGSPESGEESASSEEEGSSSEAVDPSETSEEADSSFPEEQTPPPSAPTPTSSPVPTVTEAPAPTAAPMPSPTSTPTPTKVPVPTATPSPAPTDTPTPTKGPDSHALYQELLEDFHKTSVGEMTRESFSEKYALEYQDSYRLDEADSPLYQLGYFFIDLDGNGIDELMIGTLKPTERMKSDGSTGYYTPLYHMFTIRNGKVKTVKTAIDTGLTLEKFWLRDDGTLCDLYYGARYGTYTLYTYENDTLVSHSTLSYSRFSTMTYSYSPTGESEDSKEIEEDYASAIISGYFDVTPDTMTPCYTP